MRFFRKLSLIIIFIFAMILSGCLERFDSSGYVKGMLDATYKGDFEKYATATKSSVNAIQEDYNGFIDHEVQVWLQYCGFTQDDLIPDDTKAQIVALIRDLYKETTYTVKEADADGNVELTIEPLNIYNAVYKDYEAFNTDFNERNDNYEFSDYTDDAFMRAYLEPIIAIFRKHMAPVPYDEPIILTVNVSPDDSGRYGISDDDVATLYNTLINYTIANAP